MAIGILRGGCAVVALALASCAGVVSAGSATVATARCKTVITGTHWSIEGAGSGNRYVLGTEGMSCAAAKRASGASMPMPVVTANAPR